MTFKPAPIPFPNADLPDYVYAREYRERYYWPQVTMAAIEAAVGAVPGVVMVDPTPEFFVVGHAWVQYLPEETSIELVVVSELYSNPDKAPPDHAAIATAWTTGTGGHVSSGSGRHHGVPRAVLWTWTLPGGAGLFQCEAEPAPE